MQHLTSNINIQVNDKIYLKDPVSSELGKKILATGIDLIDEMGFEQFTFRKLGKAIGSTEASVYRYFENKHKLLLYLTSWYWGWMEYRMAFTLANVESASARLERAINILTEPVGDDGNFAHIDEGKLYRIVISDSSKAYLTKDVDRENRDGAFAGYKRLVQRVSDVVMEINPDYKYPHMLISTVIEGAHHQRFFAGHLPGLTDVVDGEDAVTECYKSMVFKTICHTL